MPGAGAITRAGSTITVATALAALAAAAAAGTAGWQPRAQLGTGRDALAAASGADGAIYAIGGALQSGAPTGAVEAYDASANRWTPRAPLAIARSALAAAAGKQGRIYAIGGLGERTVTNELDQFDPTTDTWTTRSPMPTARDELAAARGGDGRIYAIGGRNPGAGIDALATVEAYSPPADAWTTVDPLPTARTWVHAATDPQGRIYAAGGFTDAGASNEVDRYDPATGHWTVLAPMPRQRGFVQVAVAGDGRLYAAAGHGTTRQSNKLVEVYDPSTDSWSLGPRTLTWQETAVGVSSGGSIYLVGSGVRGRYVESLRRP